MTKYGNGTKATYTNCLNNAKEALGRTIICLDKAFDDAPNEEARQEISMLIRLVSHINDETTKLTP